MNGIMWFVVIMAAISVMSSRGCGRARRHEQPERTSATEPTSERVSDQLADMSARLERLEEERDFYRDLLGSSRRFRQPSE